jgi:actin-related protein
MEAFKGNEGVVRNQSTRKEGALVFRNQIMKMRAESINHALGDNFVDDVAQGDGSILSQIRRISRLGNKDDFCKVEVFWELTFFEKILNRSTNLIFLEGPSSFEKI